MTVYAPVPSIAIQDRGPASDPGPGANEPAGYTRYASNAFGSVTPRTWHIADASALSVVDAASVGMTTESGKSFKVRFAAGTYSNMDPCNTLQPENSPPLWQAPTGWYKRYTMRLPTGWMMWGPGASSNGDGNVKHDYTQATQSDLHDAAPYRAGSGLTYGFTTGVRVEGGGSGKDTTSPMLMAGACDFVLSVYDPYYNSGAGKDICRRGFVVPDLEVDIADLTIAYSASGAFQRYFADGVAIDGFCITGSPYAAAGKMLPNTIDHWIDAHHVQMVGNAMIAQSNGDETGVAGALPPSTGAVSVNGGLFAPFIGDEGGGGGIFYPNVPPNAMADGNATIPAGARIVRGTDYEIEALFVLNSSASGIGAAADGIFRMWLNGTLTHDWKVQRDSRLGRWLNSWFTQQVPMEGTFASDYFAYFGDFYYSIGWHRAGEQPKQYNVTTSDTPTHGATITVQAALVDYNGEAVRTQFSFNAAPTANQGSVTATGGATVQSGELVSSVNGLLSFTVTLPAGVGVDVAITVSDLGSPVRTGTLTVTTV
jgi:hypothetical protein